MFRFIPKLLTQKKNPAASAKEQMPYLWDIYCINAVNTLFPEAPDSSVLCPPFFQAKEIPAMNKRVKEAVHYYSPVMLYNTLKFEGAPKDEALINTAELLNNSLATAETSNPWVKYLREAGTARIKPGVYFEKLSSDAKVELNLARPAYEEIISDGVDKISTWFYDNWEAHKHWAMSK